MTAKEGLRGYIWWCGDEVCDCTQPVIERRTKLGEAHWSAKRVWEGTFVSGPNEDRSMQADELAIAAREHGLVRAAEDRYEEVSS